MNTPPTLVWAALRHTARALALSFVATSAAACGSGVVLQTKTSPVPNFTPYRSIAIEPLAAPPLRYESSPRSGEARAEIRDVTIHVLQHRGYVVADPASADLILEIENGTRSKRELVLATPVRSSDRPAYPGFEFVEQSVTEGSFVIGAFDRRTRALVWEGAAHADIDAGHVDHLRLDGTVAAALASFPAPGARWSTR